MNAPTSRLGSRRIRRTATEFALVLAVAGALLAGCTHGNGGDGVAASGPHPAEAAGSAAAGSPGSAPTTGAATGTVPQTENPDAPAGPSIVTATVGGTATTVTVPPAADPLGAVATHPTGAVDAAVAEILPGAYGLANLGARVQGATIELAAQGGCEFALDVIRSGQWALTPVLAPHDGGTVNLDVLNRGDRSALLSLTESTGLCTGRIVTETQQPLTLTGTISATGPAHAVTVVCVAQADGPPAHSIMVSYATSTAALMAMATVPDSSGTHRLDADNPAGVIEYDPHRSALAQAASTARAFFDPSSITAEATLPGVDERNAWFQETGATVTVTSTDPLAGTLNAPHLRRESGGGSAAFSAGFSC